jgi:hypothetical protein
MTSYISAKCGAYKAPRGENPVPAAGIEVSQRIN